MEIKFNEKFFWYSILTITLILSLYFNLSVSISEPLVFGDEGYYAARGEWMAQNMEIPVSDEIYGDSLNVEYLTKPPETFLILASFYTIAGDSGMRVLLPIVSIISALMLFLLTKKIHSTRAATLAVIFYLMMPALITHTVFLYTEHIALMFIISSVYFFYKYLEDNKKINILMTAILFGFSALTEVSSVLFGLIFIIVLFVYKKKWNERIKDSLLIIIVLFLFISPWAIGHNYIQTGNPDYKLSKVFKTVGLDVQFRGKESVEESLPEVETVGLREPQESGTGTAAPLHKFGFTNYAEFAYTLPAFIFSLLGFSYYFIEKKKKYIIPVLWAILLFSAVYILFGTTRVEGLSRNTVIIIAPLAISAGFFASKIYDYLSSFDKVGKFIGVIFVIFLLFWGMGRASEKSESLRPIKHFSDAFFVGCDWIRENTPEDTIIYNMWGSRAEYHCKRTPIGNAEPKMGDAILLQNDTTYEIFDLYGIEYLYIQKFSIKEGREKVSYPLSFVQYIESSDKYKKVYSYPENCLYNPNIIDCVIVYELTDGNEDTTQMSQINPFQ